MKKLLLFTIAAAITTMASAQIQFGLKAGLNLSNLSVSQKDGATISILPSFNAGALVSIPLFSNFKLQPEVMYSGQGANLKADGASGHYNFNYVNIPVLFKYQDPSGFFAEIGPQAGFVVSAKVKSDGNSLDVKDQLKSTDFAGVFGIGFLSSVNLGIDARYNLGFVNLAKNADQSSDGTVKNGVIQVSVFYLFGKSHHKK